MTIDDMKKALRLCSLLLVLVLSSCSGGVPGISLPGLGGSKTDETAATPRGFYDNLANEYKNLANFEDEFRPEAGDAMHFAAKARRALREQNVEPDRPVERNIPDFSIEEMQSAYDMLVDALETLRSPNNDPLLAMAQTRYDCWLAHQENAQAPDAWLACKSTFYNALALLEIPKRDSDPYAVYFESGTAELDEESQKVLAEIAEKYGDRDQWDIVLKGYTDSKGDKSQNKQLSMRRAIAVKHMLGQYGINLDNIAISAEGEAKSDQEDSRESRRVEIRAWPHYAAKNKKGIHVLSGWSHSGEF